MKPSIKILLSLVIGILLLSSCDTVAPAEESQYKKQNDAYFNDAEKLGYKKLPFLNAEYPIYYKVIELSTKDSPLYPIQDSTVKINISGELITGEIFQKEGIITTDINKFVLGVQYALQSMNEGDHWKIIIPYQLGYGPYTHTATIPGFSTLIFDIKLLEVIKK